MRVNQEIGYGVDLIQRLQAFLNYASVWEKKFGALITRIDMDCTNC